MPPSACSKRPRNQFLAVPDLPLISTVGFAKAAWAPDSPLGFAFGEACRAHDRCYAEGGGFSDCNAGFYTALREAAGGNIVGEALALLYATANYALGWAWYGFPPQDPFGGPNGG